MKSQREDLHCDNVEGIFIEILSKKSSKHLFIYFSIYIQAS